MQMLENYLFFDTLNAIIIKVRIHIFTKSHAQFDNELSS